jgi:predicted unusual protein kinase regulating ubiquinone biosynthesis (AarF/ABC1/UbiB family)
MKAPRVAAIVTVGAGAGAAAALLHRAWGKLKEASSVVSWRQRRLWKLTARNAGRFATTRAKRMVTPAERRAELDAQFAIRTAEDVARELGEMKGVLMKVGQLVSFIAEGLPDEAQQALAALQADAAPMAPSLAAEVIEGEFGAPPERVFATWEDLPVAAASIGQVHRARDASGRELAVKVQFPGVAEAIEEDLDAAEVMYTVFSALALNGLDARALVDELRLRMREELDYRREAANIAQFAERFAGHPWVRIPALAPEFSTAKVLTTEWIDGLAWDQFVSTASAPTKQRAGVVMLSFV